MIFAPPRHGKSRSVSELFPAWALGINPDEQFLICSHAASLAYTFSRNVRNLLTDERYVELFPETQLSDDNALIQKWTLVDHTRPAMMALGVGGSPTGQGAKILIIDDPIGDVAEAESALARESVYRWYTDTIYPRLEPEAVIILMMQRWHEDDLAGRLLRDRERADKWDVVMLPALAEANDPLGRSPGDALWPERYPLSALEAIRKVSPRSFEAKYQQRPRPPEGAMFKRTWLSRIVDANAVPAGLRWFRYYDLAYSLKRMADNSASLAGGMGGDGTLYLRRGWAAKMETPDLRKRIMLTIMGERDTTHGIERALHGGAVVQELMREPLLVGSSFYAVDVDTDKVARATPVADRAETGKVAWVRETPNDDAWIADWVDELCAFPYGQRDDRVDTVSGVAAMVAGPKGGVTKSAPAKVTTAGSLFR